MRTLAKETGLIWVPLPNGCAKNQYGYILNRQAVLFNRHGRIMKTEARRPNGTGTEGRLRVRMWIDGKAHWFQLSRLVLEAFVGKPPTLFHHACHIDGNILNNRLYNLKWGTAKQNSDDKRLTGTHPSQIKGKRKKP